MVTLVTKDAKGKVRVAELDYEWSDEQHAFIMHRTTYQLGGKKTQQPDKLVTKGKVKRTISEQVKLEFEHLIKEYKDKGYKELDNPIEKYSVQELNEIIGKEVTGSTGVVKPMLAKQADKVTNKNVYNKQYYASRKIDGLRCLIYLGNDGKLHTSSRGATNYDSAMSDILKHPTLIKLFTKNPWLIMDGECYKHGLSLQEINSVARTQVTAVDYEILQFYWYDIVDTNRTFEERLQRMLAIKNALQLGFDPEREFRDGELRIQFVPQEPISGWNSIEQKHNEYISEGWEGLVIRNVDSKYGPNKRTNDMIKVKMYRDDCFKVVGYELGLRGSEDMVFIMEMEDGRTFKAKPFGDRKQKEEYVDNFEEKYNQHIGECKFFYYSNDGIPLQPSFKAFRDDLN